MATLNLGRIKPIFKGAYAGGTAYVVDDIVTSGNECFICILASTGNATSNATYWTKLAAKGADGTDVGTTITTQGDILYRDGSGLQRLAKPASDKFLQNTSGGVVSWETVATAILQMKSVSAGTEQLIQNNSTWTGTSGTEYTPLTTTFTPTLANSTLMIDYHIMASHYSDYCGVYWLSYNHSGISETVVENDSSYGGTHCFDYSGNTSSDMGAGINGRIFLSLATTNEITFKNRFATAAGIAAGTGGNATVNIHRTYTGNGNSDSFAGVSTFTVTELANAITTHTKGANILGD